MTTWIVMADGMHARVLPRAAPGATLSRVFDEDSVPADTNAFTRDLGTDRPGRAFDPGSGGRHAMEPHSDPHERHKVEFAHQIAKMINEAVEQKRCAQLVLVAPPKTLGALREKLSAKALEQVVAESAKDLMKIPVAELPGHLDPLLAQRRHAL